MSNCSDIATPAARATKAENRLGKICGYSQDCLHHKS